MRIGLSVFAFAILSLSAVDFANAVMMSKEQAIEIQNILNSDLEGRLVYLPLDQVMTQEEMAPIELWDNDGGRLRFEAREASVKLGLIQILQLKLGLKTMGWEVVFFDGDNEVGYIDPQDFFIKRGNRYINLTRFLQAPLSFSLNPQKECYQLRQVADQFIILYACM